MKYGELFAYREAVQKLKALPFQDGNLLVTTRKFVKMFFTVLEPYSEIYNEAITKYGKNNQLDATSKNWEKFAEVVNKAGQGEVEWKVTPFVHETFFLSMTGLGLSINDLEIYEALGIMKDPAEPEAAGKKKKSKKKTDLKLVPQEVVDENA